MIESYILTADGKEYVDVDSVREALGIVDEDVNILGVIRKLKEERERYKSNCNYFAGIAQDRLRDRNKLELELREALGTVDEYADILGLVRKLKQERDELRERLWNYRFIANAQYGISCGHSTKPTFRCDVISYSWNLGSIAPCSLMDEPSYQANPDSIRVELDLTPTSNYKGTFDLEDLRRYIQEYGRDKKLGVLESIDYQNAKAARVHLAELYKQIMGNKLLDVSTKDTSKAASKAILDEVDTMRKAYKRLDEEAAKLRKFRNKVFEAIWGGRPVPEAPWDDDHALTKILELKEFRRNVAERINRSADIRTSKVIMHALDIELERGETMDKLRDKLMDILGYELKPGGVDKNNSAILEMVKKLKDTKEGKYALCDEMAKTLDRLMDILGAGDNEELVKTVEERQRELHELRQKYSSQYGLRQRWHARYESEHTRANGEHKRAEKCFGEIAALKTQVASLERSLASSSNERVGIDAFRNEIRKLEAEKGKVIEALGQDIWDDCVK